MSRPTRFVSAALAAAVVCSSAAFAGPAALPLRTVACGDTLTASARIANGLKDCPANGLVVGAPGITIDLGGHRIDGAGAELSIGVSNAAGHANVTIRNGTVTGFFDGVLVQNATGNTVTAVRALQNQNGIRLFQASGNELRGNVASDNGNGFVVEEVSNDNVLVANEGLGNFYDGFYVYKSSRNTLAGNTASANASYGFEIFTASGNLLKGNTAVGSDGAGIVIDVDASDNVLKGNRSSGNGTHGIEIFSGTGNLLTRNTFEANAGHGVRSDTSALELRANRADRNGYANGNADGLGLGILVPAGAVQSGNKAAGNDDGRECQSDELSCAVPSVPVTRR